MFILLLRGYSNSGKDYVGSILCKEYGYKRFAFADSLKKIIAEEFNCDLEQLHSQDGKIKICENDKLKRTFRQILIDESLKLKEKDQDIFAKKCCEEIQNNGIIPDKIVITDWRFPNELQVIEKYFPNHKKHIIHIQRYDQLNSPVDNISEYHLINRTNDYTIVNYMNDNIYADIENLIKDISR